MVNILFSIFYSATWQTAVILLVVLLLLALFGERLEPRWRYLLWCVVLLRLALPILPASPWGLWQSGEFAVQKIEQNCMQTAAVQRHAIAVIENTPTSPLAFDDMTTETTSGEISINVQSQWQALEDMSFDSQKETFENDGEMFPASVFDVSRDETTTEQSANSSYEEAAASPPESVSGRAWPFVKGAFFALWVGGMLIFALRHLHGEVRLYRRSRFWKRATDPQLLVLLNECRKLVGVHRRVEIFLAPGEIGAASTGLLRPRIILSETAAVQFSHNELKMVLLHELTHIRRYDPLVQRAVIILSVIHWLNPSVWFAILRLQRDRELACDAAVLNILGPHKQKEYGMVIVAFAELFSAHEQLPGLVGVFQKHGISRRIEMIVKYKKTKWYQSLLGAMLITLVAAFGLTKAQQPQPEETSNEPTAVTEENTEYAQEAQTHPKEFRPFPPGTTNWVYRRDPFASLKCRKAASEIVFIRAENDDVFTFDCKQSLWRNEKTGETHLEIFLIGKDAFYRLGQEFDDEPSRQEALARRNKVDQRYHGCVAKVNLRAGKENGVNNDYAFDFDTWQWREWNSENLISPEELRTLENLNTRIVDTATVEDARYLITWQNRGETILGRNLPETEEPYHIEPPDAPSPFPANAETSMFYFYFPEKIRRVTEKTFNSDEIRYVRLGPESVFSFENGLWHDKTTGDSSPEFFVEGDFGILLLDRTSDGKIGQIGTLKVMAESEQGIYAYRNGRWINLETNENTTQNVLKQDDSLQVQLQKESALELHLQMSSMTCLAFGTEIHLSRLGRKISVLASRPEFVERLDNANLPPILAEDDVLVFADGTWKSEKTGEHWPHKTFLSLWGSLFSVTRNQDGTGTVRQTGSQEFGISNQGKYIRLSNGGMTCETSNTPFSQSDTRFDWEGDKKEMRYLNNIEVLVFENGQWRDEKSGEVFEGQLLGSLMMNHDKFNGLYVFGHNKEKGRLAQCALRILFEGLGSVTLRQYENESVTPKQTVIELAKGEVLAYEQNGKWKNSVTGEECYGILTEGTATGLQLVRWPEPHTKYLQFIEAKYIRLSDYGLTVEYGDSAEKTQRKTLSPILPVELTLGKNDVLVYENNTWFNEQTKAIYPLGSIVKSESGGLWRLEEGKFHRLHGHGTGGEGCYIEVRKEGQHIEVSSLPGPVVRVLGDVLGINEKSNK